MYMLKTSSIFFSCIVTLTFFALGQGHQKPVKLSLKKLDSLEKDYYKWFKNTYEKRFDLYLIHEVENQWSRDSAYVLTIENDVVYPYVKGKVFKCTENIGLYKKTKVAFRDNKGQLQWTKMFKLGESVGGRIISHYGSLVEMSIIDTSSDWESKYSAAYPYWTYFINKHGSVVYKHEPSDNFSFLFASDSGNYIVCKEDRNWPYYLIIGTKKNTIDTCRNEDIKGIDDSGYIERTYTPIVGKIVTERIHIDSLRRLQANGRPE